MNLAERNYVEALKTALADFLDNEPCQLDRHGYCQTHGLSKPCRMVAAREVLSGYSQRREVRCRDCDRWYIAQEPSCPCGSMRRGETRPIRRRVVIPELEATE